MTSSSSLIRDIQNWNIPILWNIRPKMPVWSANHSALKKGLFLETSQYLPLLLSSVHLEIQNLFRILKAKSVTSLGALLMLLGW